MSDTELQRRKTTDDEVQAVTGELVSPNETLPVVPVEERRELLATYATITEADVLLSYSWLCDATLEHIQRLHYDNKSKRTVETMQSRLTKAGYVERHDRGQRKATRRHTAAASVDETQTGRLPSSWSLLDAGRDAIRQHEGYPANDARGQYRARSQDRSDVLRNHSLMVSDVAVELVCRARPFGLSGVYLGRDLRLDPERKRPCMDALLILHFHGAGCAPNAVPWTKDPASTQERSLRYAIEVDTGSEAIATVTAKAGEYAAILRADNSRWRAWWEERYGARPYVLVVLPDNRARFDAVYEGWVAAWPGGAWAMTMVSWLRDDKWLIYHQAEKRSEWFSLGKPRQVPALPVAPKALPVLPDVLEQARAHLVTAGYDAVLVARAVSIDVPPKGAYSYMRFERLPEALRADAVLVVSQRRADNTLHAVEAAEQAELGYLVLSVQLEQYKAAKKAREAAEAKAKADAEAATAARVQAEEQRRARLEAERRALAALRAQQEAQQAIEQARYARWGVLYDAYKALGVAWSVVVAVVLWFLDSLWLTVGIVLRAFWFAGTWARENPRRAAWVAGVLVVVGVAGWVYVARPAVAWPALPWSAGGEQQADAAPVDQAATVPVVVEELPQVPAATVLPAEVNGYPVCGVVEVTARRVNMRVGPGTKYDSLHKLNVGEKLYMLCDATEKGGGYEWQRVVRDTDVVAGWVATVYVRKVP